MSDTTCKTYKNYINGQWVEPGSGQYYTVYNPARTSEAVGSFPLSTTDDVDKAAQAAQAQFLKWKELSPSERTDYVYRFIDLLAANKERLAEAATKEQGKLYKESLGEPTRGVKEMTIVAGEALRLEGIARPCESKRTTNVAERIPLGVVAAITPWNFPILTPLRKIIPALTSGCTVVFKPASSTPLTAVILTELIEQAGFPAGAMNLVIGKGREIGDALVSNPLVSGITFTGSTGVGRNINRLAAGHFAKVQLEMGGKNAAVVADCAKLEEVAGKIVAAAYTNAGQRCTAISRVIVLESQAEQLERLIVEKASQLKTGDGMDKQVQMGPLVSRDAIKTVEDYVGYAVEEGAEIALGGKRLTGGVYDDGYYFAPTVITRVTPGMRVAREEIFGPVLVIIRAGSYAQAIDICNDTEYGLTASVFTDSMAFTYDFTKKVEVGMVRVNNLGVSGGNMPFGGHKNSGLGAFSIGHTNMDFYTNIKVVYIEYDE